MSKGRTTRKISPMAFHWNFSRKIEGKVFEPTPPQCLGLGYISHGFVRKISLKKNKKKDSEEI